MKRRTLDLAFSIGGALFAVLLLVLGLVLKDQADFAESYVHDQLAEQEITFPEKDALGSEEEFQATILELFNGDQAAADAFIEQKGLTSEEKSECLNKYAGQQMLTGPQAECYAEDYIKLHASESSVVNGKAYTYSTIGGLVREARTAVTEAKEAGAPQEEIDALQAEADRLQSLRVDTLLRADTLRGLLLTSYGFSIFGDKAALAATVCYIAAALLMLLAIAGFIHASTKSAKEHVIE
ncbi:MAG TPA: hypothetical protein DCR14_07020 [Acidimicrobiaceae bacterium]|nr:hypothetical protein [Acidimicrobiaceae bacterium]